jgi:acyl-lipid omega-6 desaturase (Delta-12 desaturase)
MNPFMNWFTGNIGYHHVHHLNARIPFYRLPEAMAGLQELQKPASTSLRPSDVWACLRSNLWDPEKERFVSFREAQVSRVRLTSL